MFLKLLIISLVLMAFVVLALGVKLWFDPNAEFSSHSCALDNGELDETGACSKCQLKELTNCPEKTDANDKE
jgi:hypothetical protein